MSRRGAGALRLLIKSPYGGQVITYEWRGQFSNAEIGALHAQGFGGRQAPERGWQAQVECHSLGWVCARDGGGMAGFVNVAWDGATHALILDTVVASHLRHQGVGTGLVTVAVQESRALAASGCTSISRMTFAGSTWAPADSGPQARGSSPCDASRRKNGLETCALMPLRVRCADSTSAWVGVLAGAEILVLKPGTFRSMVAGVCAGLVSAAGQ